MKASTFTSLGVMWLFERKAFDLCPKVCNLRRVGYINEMAKVRHNANFWLGMWNGGHVCMNG